MRQLQTVPLASVFRFAGWIGILIIAVLSLVPGAERPHTGAPSQIEHYAAYLLVGFVLALGYVQNRSVVSIGLLLVLYAGLLEFAQLFIPGRSARVIDILVSAMGAWTGIVLAFVFYYRNVIHQRSQPTSFQNHRCVQ
jgi:VanZ family protein